MKVQDAILVDFISFLSIKQEHLKTKNLNFRVKKDLNFSYYSEKLGKKERNLISVFANFKIIVRNFGIFNRLKEILL